MNIHVQAPRPGAKPRSAFEIALYRQCRAWHGYLSAFAFIALMFFSATGILLNHPDWIARVQSGAYRDWMAANYAARSTAR